MVDAGLLERVDYRDGGRTRQGYTAARAAAELLPILQQLAIWGERHTALPAGGDHMALIHEECGHEATRGEACSSCGELLVPEAMTWVKPWKGARDGLVGPGVLAVPVEGWALRLPDQADSASAADVDGRPMRSCRSVLSEYSAPLVMTPSIPATIAAVSAGRPNPSSVAWYSSTDWST